MADQQQHHRFDTTGLSPEWREAIEAARTFTDSLDDGQVRAVAWAINERLFPESVADLKQLLRSALLTDRLEYKQWYIEQIAAAMNVDLIGLGYPHGTKPPWEAEPAPHQEG